MVERALSTKLPTTIVTQAMAIWAAHAAATTDTGIPIKPIGPLALGGALQGKSAAWGGTTLTLEQSVNGTDWAPVIDIDTGVAIALTTNTQVASFSVASPYLRTRVFNGTGTGIVPSLYMRG